MTGRQRNGLFLSYARSDGEAFAERLRDKLRRQAPDVPVRQDRLLLEGGVGWWNQIADAIDSVEFLVLVMTPSALRSEVVRKEWRYARQQGVCVYPVKGAPDEELRFTDLPQWMARAHFFDIEREWESFVQHLRSPCRTPRVPFMAPELPETFVQRPAEFGRLKEHLLGSRGHTPVAITTALSGAGGFGKTTLAAALCHDEDIVRNFDDGILWVTLGQTPDVMAGLLTLYAALTGERPGFASVDDAAFQLGQKLENRSCLLVIDDVWNAAHLRSLLRAAKGCARLFTTRDTAIASEAARVDVDEMSASESLALLSAGVPGMDAHLARRMATRLGEWPLAIELARATVQRRIQNGDTTERAIRYVEQALDKRGVGFLKKDTADARHQTIEGTVAASLELLSSQDRQRFQELSIFPEDVAIPLSAAGSLWGTDEFDTEEIATNLAKLSLLKVDLQRGTMRLHDVLRSWIARRTENPAELHSRLVDSWPDWHQLPDAYAWRWLTWHLAQAGRNEDLLRVLWDGKWLEAKLLAAGPNALLADFSLATFEPEAELVYKALRLSAHVLAQDPKQLMGQMCGRLEPSIAPRSERMIETHRAASAWIRPLTRSLDSPGSVLMRTFTGHTAWVNAVAVCADGKRAISASYDSTLKLWDLDSGEALRTLSGHSDWVTAVAVCAGRNRAISASNDKTLKLWDLDSGQVLRTLSAHRDRVTAVAFCADGKQAISASNDNTMKVWDVDSGQELRTLSGHSDWVAAVAVCPDGKRAISASYDNTLKLWDLSSGQKLRSLSGHSDWVTAVAVCTDGKRAISASYDNTLKLWDLDNRQELHTPSSHNDRVTAVAVCADGKRGISGSRDKMLKLWDLDTGQELHTLSGHGDWVTAVAVCADGKRVISASDDYTLKLWDLDSGQELHTFSGHTAGVAAVAVFADGERAISGSNDNTLKLWDLHSGQEMCTFFGHSDRVTAVAVCADGKRAISACRSKTLKVWDLDSGRELRTLSGHWKRVTAVAVCADGMRAISASNDNTLRLWDLNSAHELRTLAGHSHGVTWVALVPDGTRAISASDDNTLKLWDLESGSVIATFTADAPIKACAVVSSSKFVAGDSRGRMHFLKLEPGC